MRNLHSVLSKINAPVSDKTLSTECFLSDVHNNNITLKTSDISVLMKSICYTVTQCASKTKDSNTVKYYSVSFSSTLITASILLLFLFYYYC